MKICLCFGSVKHLKVKWEYMHCQFLLIKEILFVTLTGKWCNKHFKDFWRKANTIPIQFLSKHSGFLHVNSLGVKYNQIQRQLIHKTFWVFKEKNSVGAAEPSYIFNSLKTNFLDGLSRTEQRYLSFSRQIALPHPRFTNIEQIVCHKIHSFILRISEPQIQLSLSSFSTWPLTNTQNTKMKKWNNTVENLIGID